MGIPYAEVIGDPIAHSKSPLIHEFWLGKLGLDYDYRARHVSTERACPPISTARRRDPAWRGCNITIPHKQAAIAHLDDLVYPAGAIGAVNVIAREGAQEPG